MNDTGNKRPNVVILGGGFAGLAASRALSKQNVNITLVDRENHHLFQPLLYQVATSGLSAAEIGQPIRHILEKQKNLTVLMDEVRKIDIDERQVICENGTLDYDYVIVGLGLRTGYFGNNSWAEVAPGLKNLDEATDIRRRILFAFEDAERSMDLPDSEQKLDFVVVGGGPTGVELAGAVAELARHVLHNEFRRIDSTKAKVHLIEAGPRLLPAFDEKQSEYTLSRLEQMGVTVHLNTPVSDVTEDSVTAGKLKLNSVVTLWAAGVESGRAPRTISKVERDRAGRIKVENDLSLPGHKEVFIVGDLISLKDVKGQIVPGVAPAAIQTGGHAAKQIVNDLKQKSRAPFVYKDKGNMATIGRSRAVAKVGKISADGLIAWLMWLVVHLLFIIGMRNQITIMLHWIWSYFTWQRGARVISKKRIVQAPEAPDESGGSSI